MKKNILSIIILSLMIAYPAFSIHHGHSDPHGHGHKNDEESKIIIDDNQYLTNLNLMKGHLWIGIQLFKASFKVDEESSIAFRLSKAFVADPCRNPNDGLRLVRGQTLNRVTPI